MRITTWMTTAALLALAPGAAAAGGLDAACAALDRSDATACALEHGADWTLTTSLVVGGGDKARVTGVEERFCRAAQARGVPARVVRWNRMPGLDVPAAKLEWRCGQTAVSTAPPQRRR